MKRVRPDIGQTLKSEFIGDIGTLKKLKKLWGTTSFEGTEIFTPRQYYHGENLRSDNFEKLFKMLKAYEDVTTADYEGIKSAWLYFNKNKAAELGIDYNDFVSDNLNKIWWDPEDGEMPEGLTLTTSIVINTFSLSGANKTTVDNIINPTMTVSEAIVAIEENYEELWELCKISQEGVGVINKGSITDPVNKIEIPDEDDLSPDDPWMSTLARYALRNAGVACTIKDVSIGTFTQSFAFTKHFYTTYVVDIEIPYKVFSPGNLFVQNIAFDISRPQKKDLNSNPYTTKQSIQSMDSTDLEDEDLITRPYVLWDEVSAESDSRFTDLWIKSGKQWYLKTEAFNDPRAFGFTYKELSAYLTGIIDSDYKKKSIPWYKKFIAYALVIIAVVVAIYLTVVGGPAGTTLGAKLVAAATAILTISLAITITIIAFSVLGMDEWAAAFAKASDLIEPLVILATIILIYDFTAQATDAAKKQVAEQLKKEVADVTLSEVLVQSVKNFVTNLADNLVQGTIQGAKDVFSGSFSTDLAGAFLRRMGSLINIASSLKLESINSRTRDLLLENEELEAEMSREVDALKGFSKLYGKPATADWSIYASTFDLPYERGGGALAMGNVLRTTKQAIRKADYSDPAFAGILII